MNNKELFSCTYHVYQLMTAAQGNLHNCMYIECSNCKYEKSPFCYDFIFSTRHDGSPILLPVSDANLIKGFSQDKSDYLGVISHSRFNDLFFLFLMENNTSPHNCPITSLFIAQNTLSENFVKIAQK